MFGLDYVTGPPVANLKAAGVKFVCRYLSEVNAATQVKLLSAAEAKMLGQAGIAIVSNYEWTGTTPLGGHDAGVFDAQIARDQHAAAGGPADRPIYFSVDFGATPAQMAAVTDYFHGVASVIGLARTGAYGSYFVIKSLLDAGAIKWAWQTYAWSGSAWDQRAHIRQYSNGETLAGMSVDYNESKQPDFGQWIPGGTMFQYTPQSSDFDQWFTATNADHWLCKATGKALQFGIRGFYAKLSIDGDHLPILGLPKTDEIYLTLSGKQIVLQVFERGAIWYDSSHVKGTQPGTDGICQLAFLTDSDMLAHIPGLALPTQQPAPVDTTALLAAINAIPDAIAQATATATAQAVVEAKKL